ncbi:hypothetical protein BT93_H3848 [Corymbia citriodora subsp. variegata]|nr:hypothetical protein BT93_H3848 [Corymbia citriodora subsp. variegata]
MAKKPSLGRQKIAISKIPKKNHLQVTFSKRRSGLFKKASELCTLCGVDIGIIVFSPASKVFSFGHPEVEFIIDRFLAQDPAPPESGECRLIEAHRNANLRDLNGILTQVLEELEAERKRGEALDEMRRESQRQCWWEAPIDELGLCELEQLGGSMEELKKNVMRWINELMVESCSPNGEIAYESKPLDVNGAYNHGHVYNFHDQNGLF